MKTKLFFTSLVLLCTIGAFTQHPVKCSHRAAFEKSWISDTLDAISYTIYLKSFDFANHELVAQTDVLLSAKVNNLNEVYLELMDLTVDSVFVDGIKIITFNHTGTILTIPLNLPINIGENILVSVYYHGEPFHEDWGGFHWSGNYAFNLGVGFVSIPHNLGKTWFPCIDDFHDRAFYTIYATVENGMDAVCGGILDEIVNNGNGTSTFKWVMEQTIPTYLASVAVGDYARWTNTYNGINEIIPIEIWVKPADSIKVEGSFTNLNNILAIYEDKFGPYRWDRVGYVGTEIGAMEHATNIAYPHFTINGGLTYESLLAHELAHMWFGDNVTCASAEDMWINEGWATFMDGIYQEFLYSRDQYLNFLRTKHKNVIQFCHTSSGAGSYFPLNQIPQNYTYDQLAAYDRGAIMAHTLRGYFGDEIFFNAMAEFNEEYKYNYASSEDMRDFLTGYTGINMTGWFDNWVFHSGTPHYSVDSFAVVPAGNGADVTVYMKQKRHGPQFIGNGNRVELTFMDENWNQFTGTISFDGATGNEVFNVPFVPEAIFLDLKELIFDAITDYSATVKQTGEINFGNCFFKLDVQSISDSAFIRIEHNWAPPDSLKNPVQGLILSPYRYWKFDGVFSGDFQAKGVFMYNTNAFLDDGLILDPNDSIVILYRQGTAYDWQFIPFTQVGPWAIGNLHVENLQKGEYTLAVCDDTFVGLNVHHEKKNTGLNIYPNPSNGNFSIEISQPGFLMFYDISGKLFESCKVDGDNKIFIWEAGDLNEGTYYVKFKSLLNETIATKKLIVVKN